jgi:tyrosinase
MRGKGEAGMVTRTRREVRSLGKTWNETMLWYAKAVHELRERPVTKKASWRYLAAMHDFDQAKWINLGYLVKGEALPKTAERKRYWSQCQHQTWYFLPWHRAYLHSFEDIVRDAIKSLHGPADWALPYWNYSDTKNPDASKVPQAFLDHKLPDGTPNPLFAKARHGTSVAAGDVDLTKRIADNDFEGIDQGPGEGVGGPRTIFSPSGEQEGLIEAAPHDLVHGDVGGRSGLMSYPDTAALDPIFWLHHANIDRLWEVWRNRDARNKNPTDADWLNGPTRRRAFALFGADEKDRPSNPRDVLSTTALGYDYDDISDPLAGGSRRSMRLEALAPSVQALAANQMEAPVMKKRPAAEVLGSNDKEIALGPKPVKSRVKFAPQPLKALDQSFTASAMAENTPGEPDRVFLKLENIRGKDGSGVFDVVLHKPGAPAGSAGVKAGSIALFGLEKASQAGGDHAGNGLTKTLEITDAVDAMQLDAEQAKNVDVEIVPRSDVRVEDNIKVGQISVHRQSGQ